MLAFPPFVIFEALFELMIKTNFEAIFEVIIDDSFESTFFFEPSLFAFFLQRRRYREDVAP